MFHFTHFDYNLTSTAIMDATSLYQVIGISFHRKQQTSNRRTKEAHQSLRLPDERIQLPLSEYHIQKTFMDCVDIHK